MTAPNVKFPREIRKGVRGKDVIGHKRAISRARPDLYAWITEEQGGFTDLAGDYFIDAIVAWKKSKGLGTSRVLGGRAHEVLERTHRKGYPDEWAFDKTAINLCQEYFTAVTKSPEQKIREAIVDAGLFWYGFRNIIPYVQARPFPNIKPPAVPRGLDCSEFVTICHFAGGALDPNNRGFSGEGYTGTLFRNPNSHRVGSVEELEPGDFIFYGHSAGRPGFNPGDPTHVGMYVGLIHGVRMTLQMGSFPMKFVKWNYRTDLHHFRAVKVLR